MITIVLQMKKKKRLVTKYDCSNFIIKSHKYDEWYKNDEEKSKFQPEEIIAERVNLRRQKLDHEDLYDMPPLEDDE